MKPWLAGVALATVTALALGAWQAPPASITTVAGYLAMDALPDSLALLPPPPAAGSAAEARDQEANRAALALHGGPRWDLSMQDADLSFPNAPVAFSCALGAPITEADTPRLYGLMRRTLSDLGRAPYGTKNKYRRTRPFVVNEKPQCSPAFDAVLRKDGSYPSGHASIGWGWGLILAEIAPDRADALVARGRAFAESRAVCNVHWRSDVEEGATVGSAVVARLHASPEFRADVEAARAELAAVRAQGLKPNRDCAQEAARLAAG